MQNGSFRTAPARLVERVLRAYMTRTLPQIGLPVLLLATACRSEPTPSSTEHAPTTTALAAEPSASRGSSLSEPVTPTAHVPSPAEQVVEAWNSALDARDAKGLLKLYAPAVLYYGVWRSAFSVIQTKRAAFAKTPGYRQRLGSIQISGGPVHFDAAFDKFSGADAGTEIAGYLALELVDTRFLIVEESDSITNEHARSTCGGMAFYVFNHQQTVAQHYRAVLNGSPSSRQSSMVYTEDARNMAGASGLDRVFGDLEKFEPHFWVDVESGRLKAKRSLTTEPVNFTPTELERVKQACDGSQKATPRRR